MSRAGYWREIPAQTDDVVLHFSKAAAGQRLDAQKAVEFQLGDSITFARVALQSAAIQDHDVVAAVPVDVRSLLFARGGDDAGPADAQHHGQKLLRQQK
jgi:hypothetical protein